MSTKFNSDTSNDKSGPAITFPFFNPKPRPALIGKTPLNRRFKPADLLCAQTPQSKIGGGHVDLLARDNVFGPHDSSRAAHSYYSTNVVSFSPGQVGTGASPALSIGTSGYSGTTGISGYSGWSGFSGFSGYSGFSGPSGYSGFSGISGYSGYSGVSGFSGYSGFSGKSGYSGFSGA